MHNSNVSFCIYMHTNIITGKQYIGLTSKGIEKRWKSHIALDIQKKNIMDGNNSLNQENFQ